MIRDLYLDLFFDWVPNRAIILYHSLQKIHASYSQVHVTLNHLRSLSLNFLENIQYDREGF